MRLSTDSLKIGTLLFEKLEPVLPVFPDIAEKGSPLPFCVYRITGFQPRDTKDRYNYEEVVGVEVNVAAATGAQRVELACRVKDTLEGLRGRWRGTTVNDITMTNATSSYGQDAYIMSLYFNINIDNSLKR